MSFFIFHISLGLFTFDLSFMLSKNFNFVMKNKKENLKKGKKKNMGIWIMSYLLLN